MEIDQDIVEDLFEASDKYFLPELKEICEKFLIKNLAVENAVDTINLAERFEVVNLRNAALRFLADNFRKILDKEGSVNLQNSTLFEIFNMKH